MLCVYSNNIITIGPMRSTHRTTRVYTQEPTAVGTTALNRLKLLLFIIYSSSQRRRPIYRIGEKVYDGRAHAYQRCS